MKYYLLILAMFIAIYGKSQHGLNAVFDASSNSQIDFGDGSGLTNIKDLPNSDKLSITMWMKWGDRANANVRANLFTLNSSSSGDDGVFWVQNTASNTHLEFKVSTTGGTRFDTSQTELEEGVWYHLGLIYDGSNVSIYINGVLDSQKSRTSNISALPSDAKMYMGNWAAYPRRFDGSIDEVSIWNIALTTTQLSNIKSNPESVTGANYDATGLIGYWNFDDGTAADLTASANDGTIGSDVVLPVELINFKANYNRDKVYLNWQTASELNNDYFVVEKSLDKSIEDANWEEVVRVKGAGTINTISNYGITDDNVNTNDKVIYYRLKQVDYDGKFAYSNIVAVSLQDVQDFQVYPNPSVGVFKVRGFSDNFTSSVDVYNNLGQLVYTIVAKNNVEIDISSQPSGIYFVKSGDRVIRIVKQ